MFRDFRFFIPVALFVVLLAAARYMPAQDLVGDPGQDEGSGSSPIVPGQQNRDGDPGQAEGTATGPMVPGQVEPADLAGPSCALSADCPQGEVCREGSCLAQCQDRILETIYFDFDQAAIPPHQGPKLDQVVLCLEAWRTEGLRIEAHTDQRGTREYNLVVTQRQAQAVAAELARRGIDPARLATFGYGEERPLCNSPGEACWARNRRVELIWMPLPARD